MESIVAQLLTKQQETLEKQQQLMERLVAATLQPNVQPKTADVSTASTLETTGGGSEVLMDILAKSIREFIYDPEENQIFELWYERYEDIFLVEGEKLDDAAKVRLLLRKVSTVVFDRYKDYLLPKHTREVSFNDTVETLKKLFGRKQSQFSLRVKCMQYQNGENEDIVTYAANINKKCEQFAFEKCTKDNFKCLMFVNGLQSTQHQDIRARLLKMLDAETEQNPITIDHLVAEIQNIKSLKSDIAMGEQKQIHVNAIQTRRAIETTNIQQNGEMPKRPCWQCGSMHFVRDCGYANHKCVQCGKTGHKEGYCSCFSGSKSSTNKNENTKKKNYFKARSNIKSVYTTSCTSKNRRFVSVQINNVQIKLQHDTGSDLTIISHDNWVKIGKPLLLTSRHTPRDASANRIDIIGEFDAMVVLSKKQKQSTIAVSSISNLNLLGSDLIDAFELWDLPINSYTTCNQISSITSEANIHQMFPTVFSEQIGHCTTFKVNLQLKPEAIPVFRPKRQVAYAVKDPLDKELKRLEQEGIITPVIFSEWAAPIVVVKKTSGDLRICGDYSTGLNDQLEQHNFPLPLPDDIFINFNKCSFFSIVDLNNAYMQIEVDENTKKFLVINTHRGLYTFNRLAQGVKSAPGAFQQVIESILSGIEGAFPYLDDVIIATRTREQNVKAVVQVMERFALHNITVNFDKCKFFKPSCTYLGYHVDKNGVSPDKNKISKILDLPAPKDVSELRAFLGAINYYGKFIFQMRKLRDPLDKLLKKDSKWSWNTQCQNSFEKFKELLSSELLLTHYDPRLPIKVAADASNVGLGAYICHVYPDGSEKAIYHCARSITSTEKNYAQIEKEGLALVFAVTKFHKFLYGRKFTLQTDHKPLLAIFGNKKGIPAHSANRLQRWALTLMSYDFDLEYISTANFGAADILSRLIGNTEKANEDTVIACIQIDAEVRHVADEITKALPITFNMVRAATKNDSLLQDMVHYIQTGNWPNQKSSDVKCFFARKDDLSIVDDCIMYAERLVIPKCFRKRILKELHKGHDGIERTKALARSYVYWPHLDDEIKELVQSCEKCASVAKTLPKTTLASWPQTTYPMQRIHIDIAGPVNNEYYFVIVDSFSKWPQIYKINSISTSSILDCLKDFTSQFGNPELIVSDNGTQFTSQHFSDFCSTNGIGHKFTAPYHPQSNGLAERFVDTLKRALKKLEGTGTSKEILQTFLKCYRSTPNTNALQNKTPSELFVGRNLRTNLDLLKKRDQPEIQRNEKMEQQFNKRHSAIERKYGCGDKVYVKIYKLNKTHWYPGVINKIIGNVNYEVKVDNIPCFRAVRSHANQLRPRFTNTESNQMDVLLDCFDLSPKETQTTEESVTVSAKVDPDVSNNNSIPNSIPLSTQPQPVVSNQQSFVDTNQQPSTPLTSTASQSSPSVETRSSSRRKRPPAWTADYVLPKRRRDVGIPK